MLVKRNFQKIYKINKKISKTALLNGFANQLYIRLPLRLATLGTSPLGEARDKEVPLTRDKEAPLIRGAVAEGD